MALLRDEGIVLRTYKLGEADRIVVFMTRDNGKVRAVAKGVRKTASKFGSRLEPLSQVSLLLWRGRSELDIINQVEVIARHQNIRGDLDRINAGLSMLEVVDQITQEAHVDTRTLDTLARALGVLDDLRRLRGDQALRAVADQVGPAGLGERFVHVGVILRLEVLQQRPLQSPLPRAARHVNR